MRRILLCGWIFLVAGLNSDRSVAQGYPGGVGSGRPRPTEEIPSEPSPVKPDKAAAKAYSAGMKSMGKARDLENTIAKTSDAGKKAGAEEKLQDTYGKALDEFTEVLRNRGDMFDAWNQVGLVHLKLGAYREAVDDYDHALALKPDLTEAVEHRAEAYLAINHLEEAKRAYMELFAHDRVLSDQLLSAMQAWLQNRRADAQGMLSNDLDGFERWLRERQTAAAVSN